VVHSHKLSRRRIDVLRFRLKHRLSNIDIKNALIEFGDLTNPMFDSSQDVLGGYQDPLRSGTKVSLPHNSRDYKL
jgi:hypothetical protein